MRGMISASDADYDPYMGEFYNHPISAENVRIGRFLNESSRQFPNGGRAYPVLDPGCGPSALYWAAFMPSVKVFHGFDAQSKNTTDVAEALQKARAGQIDQRYRAIALTLGRTEAEADAYIQEMAGRYHSLKVHDIAKPWPYDDQSVGAVVSCFGLDHVDKAEQFLFGLREARRVLVRDGLLVMVTLCNTKIWRCGGQPYACLRTTLESLVHDLEVTGFHPTFAEECPAEDLAERPDQGYSEMLFVRAKLAAL